MARVLTTAIVDEPYAFSQEPALTASGFLRKARERRYDVWWESRLEALHEAALLVPLLGVRADAEEVCARPGWRDTPDEQLIHALRFVSTTGPQLVEELAVGDLFDPAAEPFRPWDETSMWQGESYRTRNYIYSQFQLLGLSALRGIRYEAHESEGRIHETVVPESVLDSHRRRATQLRDLAGLLAAVEFVYYPRARRTIRYPLGDEWRLFEAARRSYDSSAALARIGWEAAEVAKEAEGLLHQAQSLDPLDAWIGLVRQIHPSKWDKLAGDARIAMDFRVAGEMLLLLHEDLVAAGEAQALPALPRFAPSPIRGRLRRKRKDLDGALTEFGLSPHPGVILALEGETEMRVMPKMLELVAGPGWPELVELLDLRGLQDPSSHGKRRDAKLEPLAAFAVVPRLGEEYGDTVMMERPPTRLLIAVDAEGAYASTQTRRRQREAIVDRMLDTLPTTYRTSVMRRELRHFVHVTTWSRSPRKRNFEYAHFTARQLAEAVIATCASPSTPGLPEMTRRIEAVMKKGNPLASLWAPKTGWTPPAPSKPDMVEYLWPHLEARALAAPTSSRAKTPLERVAVKAIELAQRPSAGHRTVLRFRRERKRATS